MTSTLPSAPTSVRALLESMEYGPAPESDAAVRAWLSKHGARFGHFVNGAFVPPHDGAHFDVHDPGTGRILAQVAQGTVTDVNNAIDAARSAQPKWGALSGHARARHLYALARTVQRHARLLAVAESLDNGKSIRETRDLDIPLVVRHFYHHAGWAQLFDSEFAGYAPLGVVGQIIPWNFPLLMLAWKVAPALAAGNTVVLKPAEFTPLSALMFAELVRDAGLPPGVFNLVTGDGTTGAAIVEHPGVDKIAFTGSTEVGRHIRKATAGTGKSLSLELGGKSPFIVFADADLDSVVEGVVDAIWFNQGQVCCAGSRLLVQEGIADALTQKLKVRMERLRVGAPLDKAVDMGAIVAPVQLDRIRELVAQGVAEGASCWQPTWAEPAEGWFYPPTLFTNVEPAATIAQVEIFGPVLVTHTFRTPDEAVQLANNTSYGLAASVWSDDINLALDIAPRIKCGVVWVNSTNLFDASAGFGGYRESGFGREGGREGMWEYVKPVRAELPKASAGKKAAAAASKNGSSAKAANNEALSDFSGASIDRTPKLYIGGKQARPDSGYSIAVHAANGALLGDVGEGNRKDIRNAVEAAHAAAGWAKKPGHARAQVLYYIAENLSARAQEFAQRIASQSGGTKADGVREVEATISRLFTYAAWADKHDGAVHDVPMRAVSLAMHEPIGVVGVVCPPAPSLLGFVSLIAPLIATGNTVVAVPSENAPLAVTDVYSVLDTSDVPGGVVNIVTGRADSLAEALASHDNVDALWYVGSHTGAVSVERASIGNLKRTWTEWTPRDWFDPRIGEGREFLRRSVQVKNIWIPYGA